MKLENMLGNFFEKTRNTIESMPWYVSLFYSSEKKAASDFLDRGEAHLKGYDGSEDWFLEQGKILNEGFALASHTVDKTYGYYDFATSLPLVGGFIESKAEEAFYTFTHTNPLVSGFVETDDANALDYIESDNDSVSFETEYTTEEEPAGRIQIPEKESMYNVIDRTYEASLSGLCFMAQAKTGKSYEYYWNELYDKPSESSYEVDDSSGLSKVMDYVNNAIDSIASIFNRGSYSYG